MKELGEYLQKFKSAPMRILPNWLLLPVNLVPNTEEGIEEFNKIYQACLNSNMERIVRTPSGGISARTIFPAFDMQHSKTCCELTICCAYGMIFFGRIQLRFTEKHQDIEHLNNSKEQYGRQAFIEFKKRCLEHGINLESYAIQNGREVKETIQAPKVKIYDDMVQHMILEDVHHIDYHSSYAGGLANTHPEFREMLQEIYDQRKFNPRMKHLANSAIGCLQSIKICGAKYANLAKDAIEDNNRRIDELTKKLEEAGRWVISFNTDGIWYQGDVYHGEGEGVKIGEWQNDKHASKFRIKSDGVYEYIDATTGIYKPVVRGRTAYDKIKPRSEWEWGDIYRSDATPKQYAVKEGVGIYEQQHQL